MVKTTKSQNLREGDGAPTLFRYRFSNILSALGRVFQMLRPPQVPFLSFYPFHVTICSFVRSRTIKAGYCVRSRVLKNEILCPLQVAFLTAVPPA